MTTNKGSTAAHDYTLRAPSPPHIHIPHIADNRELLLPDYEGIGGEDITEEDLRNITQVHHVAIDNTAHWKYEWRRNAQLILPFLYLGPSVATRDRDFLRAEGITMLLVIRDTMSAQARLLSGEKVAAELGIESAAVDVTGNQELIAAFPRAIKVINDHLIAIYRQQAISGMEPEQGNIVINEVTFKRGKILVFCESGNERSASVVAAYLMGMYGLDMVTAIQFLQSQRFCIAFNDALKGLLLSFQDILQARRDVKQAAIRDHDSCANVSNISDTEHPKTSKRGYEETVDAEMDDSGMEDDSSFDGRRNFAPFLS